MPPSGWYDDPDQPWTWRYFDGAHWTEHRSPMWVPPVRDPTSLAVWFDSSVAAVKRSARRVGVLLAFVWLALGALGSWLAIASFDDRRGRELRRLLDIDQRTLGPTGSPTTNELTTAEAERAWELLQDIFWEALPWLIALTVVFVVARGVVGRPRRPERCSNQPKRLGALAVAALRRVPAVIGSGVVVFGLFVATWLLASIPVVLVVAADGGGAAIVLTVVFVVLARRRGDGLAVGPTDVGVGDRRRRGSRPRYRSELEHHPRPVLVRGGAAADHRPGRRRTRRGSSASSTRSASSSGSRRTWPSVMLFQALAAAVAIVITVCGHLSTIDQLDDPDAAERRGADRLVTGSSPDGGGA